MSNSSRFGRQSGAISVSPSDADVHWIGHVVEKVKLKMLEVNLMVEIIY
jgi:hypothetical protein